MDFVSAGCKLPPQRMHAFWTSKGSVLEFQTYRAYDGGRRAGVGAGWQTCQWKRRRR